MKKKPKKFSMWSLPTYLFRVETPDSIYFEFEVTPKWRGSEAATTQQAKQLTQSIWWYLVNPHLPLSTSVLLEALSEECGLADYVIDYRARFPIPDDELPLLRGFLLDGNGIMIADARAGRADLANLTVNDMPKIARAAGRRV